MTMNETTTGNRPVEDIIPRLDAAVCPGELRATTERVKSELEAFCREGPVTLPRSFSECRPEGYARRLLHRNEALGYTVVVMTWGPRQATELHDHAGIWCVECVLSGELAVIQYDLVERLGDRFRFEQQKLVNAGVGTAGCLIPPFEYHVLANALHDRATMTLHVYGGEMNFCNLYRPDRPGWWTQIPKNLGYAN
jgi:predicted metal-dependent enzyme (double-stranded beta helix superfamily)